MTYIKLTNGIPENYTIEQLLIDFPSAIIYKKSKLPDEALLRQFNVYPLITVELPDLLDDETAEEGTPVFEHGQWKQTWQVRKLNEEEITAIIDNRLIETTIVLDENVGFSSFVADAAVQKSRYDICKACDSLSVLKTCDECHCIMPIKTRLADAVCPIDKW